MEMASDNGGEEKESYKYIINPTELWYSLINLVYLYNTVVLAKRLATALVFVIGHLFYKNVDNILKRLKDFNNSYYVTGPLH